MSEFVAYLREMFAEFGPVQFRRMFGGYGIFHQGLMIGLIADEMLYLKADAQLAARFLGRACAQFSYRKGNKVVRMSYYQAPPEALEQPDQLAEWAHLALRAARRAKGSR